MTAAAILALGGISVFVYAYVAYPASLWALRVLRRRHPAAHATFAEWPTVSICLPAYNEERVIAATIESLLALDYPAHRRQIVVVSDASSDRTDDIARGYRDQGVELVRLPARAGKTAAENYAREFLTGEIVVTTDASVRVHPQSLKPLIAAFADPTVGVASGRDVSVARLGDSGNAGEQGYVGYEMWVRELEGDLSGIVGASGCYFAIRNQIHREFLPEQLSRDFAAALVAREHGYRAVSVTDAICYVPATPSLRREFRRKVRTMARGLGTLWHKRRLLNPFRYGVFAWMLFSHKLARWLVPWAMAAGIIGAAMFVGQWLGGAWAVAGVALLVVTAALAWWWPDGRAMPRVLSLPAYISWGLVAGVVAWGRAFKGQQNAVWEPTRR